MKKIAIFTNSIYTMGGEQRVVCLMANEFAKKNEVTIFTMDSERKKEQLYHLDPKISVNFYRPYYLDAISFLLRAMTHLFPMIVYDCYPSMLKRAYCHDKYADLMEELIKDKFDTVIATSWQLSIVLGMVCEKYNTKFTSIGWEHSSFEAYFREKYRYLYNYEELFKNKVRHLEHIIVLNEDFAQKYNEKLGLSCKVIYNPKSFCSKEKSDLTKKQFVTCGRFDHCKGFDLLIEAFYLFSQQESDWQLKIAGDGILKSKIEKRVKELNLDGRVSFLGQIQYVDELLKESSVYLLSSRFEGFPMSITEACEIGLPIIAFDIPAMLPFKEKGVVETVPCYNVSLYAVKMLEIANDYEKRLIMKEKAIAFAEDLTSEAIYRKWELYL